MKYLVSVVEAIRVSTVEEVEQLHTELKNDSRFELKKFEYTHKDIKSKGEIIDSYELIKATLVFNNEKEPDTFVDMNFKCDIESYGGTDFNED